MGYGSLSDGKQKGNMEFWRTTHSYKHIYVTTVKHFGAIHTLDHNTGGKDHRVRQFTMYFSL